MMLSKKSCKDFWLDSFCIEVRYAQGALLLFPLGFLAGTVVRNPFAKAGDEGSIPGSGRILEEGNGSPLQFSSLGNPMDREAWWATKGFMGLQRVGHN